MRIDSISMQNEFASAKGKAMKDSSLDARQLEETKEEMEKELTKSRRNSIGGEHDTKGREYVRMQMDSMDNQTVSLLQQGYESALNFKKDSEVRGAFVDKYVKSDTSVAANTAGIYNFEKEVDGSSKTVFGGSETSPPCMASSEPETKPLDGAQKEDKSAAMPGEDEPRASAEEEDEKSEKAARNPSDDKSDRQTTVNTDRVEAEIRKLNQEKQRIQQALGRATGDDAEREKLQKRFEMIEAELSMKDTDTYRKQNAEYSGGAQ